MTVNSKHSQLIRRCALTSVALLLSFGLYMCYRNVISIGEEKKSYSEPTFPDHERVFREVHNLRIATTSLGKVSVWTDCSVMHPTFNINIGLQVAPEKEVKGRLKILIKGRLYLCLNGRQHLVASKEISRIEGPTNSRFQDYECKKGTFSKIPVPGPRVFEGSYPDFFDFTSVRESQVVPMGKYQISIVVSLTFGDVTAHCSFADQEINVNVP